MMAGEKRECLGYMSVPKSDEEFGLGCSGKRSIVIYISSETMGRGDDELGLILMRAYLDTLTNFAKEISHIILVNGGVKLATEGHEASEQLIDLANLGVEVLSCGTCLNYFHLKEKLQAGSVSNMVAIFEVLKEAGKLISP